MTYSSYTVKVPGKLMIAGEYAVLEPEQKAVVIAVNRFVTAHIEPSFQNELSLPQLSLEGVAWKLDGDSVEVNVSDSRLSFIQNAISVAAQILQEQNIIMLPFRLRIESELDDAASGKKYGLGSSAAVVVAIVSAVLRFHIEVEEVLNLQYIFKLSAIAHLKTQKSGSGADIAAAVYGGWLQYSAFNTEWVLKRLEQGTKLSVLIEKCWPNLFISSITPPDTIQLAVGWTGEAASTAAMIKGLQKFRYNHIEAYKDFLNESKMAVERLIHSFSIKDCQGAIEAISENRKVLKKLGKESGLAIETERLKALGDIAETFGGGKSSGAGGGDCGIAFTIGETQRKNLYRLWEAAGIIPLQLNVSQVGVSIFKE